ncbi:MAG: DUF3109 family protein [Thermoflexales bacterium]|nr:DUF3109 family protein [Thermoflexales bacterium]
MTEELVINGWRIEPALLEVQPVHRCDIAVCRGVCCSYGVYVAMEQKAAILLHAEMIKPYLPPDRRDESEWFCDESVADASFPSKRFDFTNTIPNPDYPDGGTCIFLRPDATCAVQVASVANGLDRWALKPFFCVLFPLVIDEWCLMLDSENPLYQHAACHGQTIPAHQPVYVLLKDEFVHALGEEGYARLVGACAKVKKPGPLKRTSRMT